MTDSHPITPPPELVQQWLGTYFGTTVTGEVSDVDLALATQAAQWGADQQLAKDAKWLDQHALDAPHLKITPAGESLIEAMRPKPPSLKERIAAAITDGDERKALKLLEELDDSL
jgi:hypothetical protein